MKKMTLLVLLLPLILHGMDEVFDAYKKEGLLSELKNAMQENNSAKKNECYKNICSHIITKNKTNHVESWQKFKDKCSQDVLGHVPVSAFFNVNGDTSSGEALNYSFINTLDDCRKILKIQLKEIKSSFVKPPPKPSILCNNLVWAGCALASGFAYGVLYGYSMC